MFTKYLDFDPIQGRVHVLYLARFLGNMFTAPKLKVSLTPLYFQRGCCMWSLIPPPSSSRSTPLSITRTRYLGRCTLYDLLMKLVALLLIPPSPLRSRLSWHRRIRRSRVLSTFLLGRISRYCPFKTSALPNEDGDPVLPRSPAPHFHFASGHSIPSQTRLSLLNLLRRRFSQRKERSAKPICIILGGVGGGGRGGEGPPADRRD